MLSFGTKFMAVDFRNAMINLIIKAYLPYSQELNCLAFTRRCDVLNIYRNTLPQSPLRKVLVDTVLAKSDSVNIISKSSDNYDSSKYYEEFLVEVLAVAFPLAKKAKKSDAPKACYDRDLASIMNILTPLMDIQVRECKMTLVSASGET